MGRFGEILLDEGLVSEEQLKHALGYQTNAKLRVGEIMLKLGTLKSHHIEDILTHQSEKEPVMKFGEIAIKLKLAESEHIDAAVKYQRTSKGMLGDILVELGYLTEENRIKITEMQTRDFN